MNPTEVVQLTLCFRDECLTKDFVEKSPNSGFLTIQV